MNYEFIANCLDISRKALDAIGADKMEKNNANRKVLMTYSGEKLIDMNTMSEEVINNSLKKYYEKLSVFMSLQNIILRKDFLPNMNKVLTYLTKYCSRKFYLESGQINPDYYGYLFLIFKPQIYVNVIMPSEHYLNDFLKTDKPSPLKPYLNMILKTE